MSSARAAHKQREQRTRQQEKKRALAAAEAAAAAVSAAESDPTSVDLRSVDSQLLREAQGIVLQEAEVIYHYFIANVWIVKKVTANSMM